MEPSAFSPPVRQLFQMLMASSIARCRASGHPCRLTTSLQFTTRDYSSESVRISISDTGNGSNLEGFKDVEDYIRRCPSAVENWDGIISVMTTSIGDSEILFYQLNLNEASPIARVSKLPSKSKNGKKFSGTELSFSANLEEGRNDFIAWATSFLKMTFILKVPMIAFELFVQNITVNGLKKECILQFSEGVVLPVSMPSIERFASALQEYIFRHGNLFDKECISCFSNSEDVKLGNGVAASSNNQGQIVEAVITLFDASRISNRTCSWKCSATTEVLYFQDFTVCSMSCSTSNALKSLNWQNFGLILKGGSINEKGHMLLEWENLSSFIQIDIALHCYSKQMKYATQVQQRASVYKNLVKKAVRLALADLKEKYNGIFLSCNASKIQSYAPDLSRTIAGLILSSKDSDFQEGCASLLGLHPHDINTEGKIESVILEKITGIIELNDRKPKRSRQENTCIFECEKSIDEDELYDEDEEPEWEDGLDS